MRNHGELIYYFFTEYDDVSVGDFCPLIVNFSLLDLLAPDFALDALSDYGCAGRGHLDPFAQNAGKPVDDTDHAINKWKYCIRCAIDVQTEDSSGNIPHYNYDVDNKECSKFKDTQFD